MKVYNLSIDSSQRDANVYLHANNYVITLENPIYDVSEIKLVSARIPTPQLTVCATNNTFSVDGQTISLPNRDYSNGVVLATHLESVLQPPSTNVDTVTFDDDTKRLTFSNITPGDHNFTFEFHTGTNGFLEDSSLVTTPYQLLGFTSADYTSTSNILTSGAINLVGPNSLVLKLTAGSDEFAQSVYTSTPFYTGHILLDGSDFINFNGADDKLTHHFHSGPQKYVRDIKIEFFYMSNGRLIPYDFMNQDHVLKFEITCSTDKLEGLPKVPLEKVVEKEEEEEEPISIPEVKNVYRWKKEYIYIALIVAVGLLLMFFMKSKSPKYPRKLSE
jgi:hypothetical protein